MLPAGFSSPYVPPPGFKFPQPNDYVRGLVGGLKAVQSDALSSAENSIIAPVKLQVSTTLATIEGATGVSVSSIADVAGAVEAIATANKTGDAVAATGRLVDGTLQLVMPLISNAVGAAAGSIPVMGQSIGMAVQALLAVINYQGINQQFQQDCDNQLAADLNTTCGDWFNKSKIVATDRMGAVPADLFRPLAYDRASPGYFITPCVAAVYAAICGPETRGMNPGWFPNIATRVPAATKRKMWTLIEAILAAVEDPLGVPIGTDGGRSAYPVLLSYIWEEKRQGRLTQEDVYNCALAIGQTFRVTKQCKGQAFLWAQAAGVTQSYGDCGGRVAGPLSDAFWETVVKGFHNTMFASSLQYTAPDGTNRTVPWYNASSKTWNLPTSVGGATDALGKVGIVRLPAATMSLVAKGHSAVQLAQTATGLAISAGTSMPTWEKGLLAASGLSAGFLSYLGVKKLAHGARR